MLKVFHVSFDATVSAHDLAHALRVALAAHKPLAYLEGHRHGDGGVYDFPARVPAGFGLVKVKYSYEYYADDEYHTGYGTAGLAIPKVAGKLRIDLTKGRAELVRIPPTALMWNEEQEAWIPLDPDWLEGLLDERSYYRESTEEVKQREEDLDLFRAWRRGFTER